MGGPWRVLQADPEGNAFSFYGRFERVEPQHLLQATVINEIFPDVLTWLRVEMAPASTGSVLVTSHLFPDRYHRDGYLHLGGMTRMREPMERLAALLKSMR